MTGGNSVLRAMQRQCRARRLRPPKNTLMGLPLELLERCVYFAVRGSGRLTQHEVLQRHQAHPSETFLVFAMGTMLDETSDLRLGALLKPFKDIDVVGERNGLEDFARDQIYKVNFAQAHVTQHYRLAPEYNHKDPSHDWTDLPLVRPHPHHLQVWIGLESDYDAIDSALPNGVGHREIILLQNIIDLYPKLESLIVSIQRSY